jgi:DNA-binding transcriptional regulator YiaG
MPFDGQQLKIARLRLGLSRTDLARMMDKSADSIRDWEDNRRSPSDVSVYMLWCKCLGENPLTPVGETKWWSDE